MALLALNIRQTLDRSGTKLPASPLRLSFPRVNRASFPAQALLSSAVAHAVVISWALFGPSLLGTSTPSRTLAAQDLNSTDHVIYLPRLGGGSEGNGHAGGGSLVRRRGSAVAPAHGTPGMSYPGQQAILSNPPSPTNNFQTIMRPALKKPPVLSAFVPAPNVVQTTNAGPLPTLDSQRPLITRPSPTQLIAPNALRKTAASAVAPNILSATNDQPKLALPTGAPQPPAPPATDMKAPRLANSRSDASAPQYSPVPTTGTDLQNLVSLSPNPSLPTASLALPAGEARGRFAIAPDSNAASAAVDAGSKTRDSLLGGPTAIGNEPEAVTGNSAGQEQAGINSGSDRLAIGGTGGTGSSTGNQIGSGNGGNGADKGRGAGAGLGLGSKTGLSAGAGSGAGVAEGTGSFPGITIGGNGNSPTSGLNVGLAPKMVYPVPAAVLLKLRRSATVVTTGSIGGGGLGNYGVLNCGKIYTIFLPMPGANWTMEYCLGPDANSTAATPIDPRSAVIHIQSPLVPPDPDSDSQFDFQRLPIPPEKAHKLIVLKGVLREDGTLDNLQIYQGLVPQMDEAARLAFSRWRFKPAMRDGKPVSVQLLVGIPSELAASGPPGAVLGTSIKP